MPPHNRRPAIARSGFAARINPKSNPKNLPPLTPCPTSSAEFLLRAPAPNRAPTGVRVEDRDAPKHRPVPRFSRERRQRSRRAPIPPRAGDDGDQGHPAPTPNLRNEPSPRPSPLYKTGHQWTLSRRFAPPSSQPDSSRHALRSEIDRPRRSAARGPSVTARYPMQPRTPAQNEPTSATTADSAQELLYYLSNCGITSRIATPIGGPGL